MIYLGRIGSCWWSYATGKISDDDWDEFIEHYIDMTMRLPDKCVGLNIAFECSNPTLKQIKRFSEFSKEYDYIISCIVHGHAFVTDSKATKAILSTINWITPKKYEEKVLSDVEEAVDWLQQVVYFDKELLMEDIDNKVNGTLLTKLLKAI